MDECTSCTTRVNSNKITKKQKSMSDSKEFQNTNRFAVVKLSHDPSQPPVVPSPRSMLSREHSPRSDTWNLSGTEGNVFGSPQTIIDSSQTPSQEILHSLSQSATGGNPRAEEKGNLLRKVKNELEAQYQCRVLQEDHQP